MNRLILAIGLVAAPAFAADPATCSSATIPLCSPGAPAGIVKIKPRAVPTSAATVTTSDAYLQTISITNTSSGALTFTLSDRQGTPVDFLTAVSIAANTTYVVAIPAGGYWCPSGFTVVASGSGLNWYGAWLQ